MRRGAREGVQGLIERASQIPDDREAMEFLQRVALIGDKTCNRELARRARSDLIERSHDTDLTSERLAAFSWLLHGGGGARSDSYTTLWTYKWVITEMPGRHEVPLRRVEALIDDLDARYQEAGLGSGAAKQLRLDVAINTGRGHEAEPLLRAWEEDERGSGSDCAACRTNLRVEYHLRRGELDEAYEAAEPLFKRRQACASVPHLTYAWFAVPLLLAGRLADARRMSRLGREMLERKQGMSATFARHAQFLAMTGYREKALKMIETRLTDALFARDGIVSIESNLALWLVCRGAIEAGEGVVVARFGPAMRRQPEDGLWDAAELGAGARERLDSMIARLDSRNGTVMWRTHTDRVLAWHLEKP